LDKLTSELQVTYIDDGLNSLVEYRALFHQTRQHFSHYFLQYAISHRNDWEWLEAEYLNLLPAAQHCHNAGNYDELLSFRDALQPYLDLQGHWRDSLTLSEWTIAAAKVLGDQITATRFTHDRADMLHQRGKYSQAERLYQACEQNYLDLGEKEMALHSRHMRVLVIRAQGQLTKAEQLCEATITDAQNLGMHSWLAHPLYVRALLARDWGDFRRAYLSIEESLSRLAESNEPAMTAQCLHFLGELAFLEGRLTEARTHLERSLQLSRSISILRRVAATQRLLGDVARVEGHLDEANNLYSEAFDMATHMGDQPQQARILLSQAQLAASLMRRQKAIGLLQNALAIYEQIGDPRGKVATSLSLSQLYLKQKDFSLALHQGRMTLKTIWEAKLLHLRVLAGVLRRRGKW
jgi:tetratricopeptide (TPR) repeat protein